jgi:mono/diheme cytochrome c family protein
VRPWPVVMALLVGCSLPLSASSKEQRAHGAALFASSGCQHCHTIGNNGGHRGPNLSNIGRTAKKAAIRDQIVNGSNVMPGFGDVLEPKEIDDLIAYLHSCREKPPKQPPAACKQFAPASASPKVAHELAVPARVHWSVPRS